MASKPEEVGLSSTQLKRLEEVTQKHIDEGLVPGAVMLVARRGKVAWMSVLGKRDVAAGDAMKFDSIFRIYSMTKPIVSVALMQMVEEGKLQVSDPVSKYLPEIGKMKVGVEKTVDGKPVLQLGDPDRADDGAGPAAPHLGPRLRLARHDPRQPGLYRRQDRRSRQHQCRVRHQALGAAVEVPARRALGIRRLGRRAGHGSSR